MTRRTRRKSAAGNMFRGAIDSGAETRGDIGGRLLPYATPYVLGVTAAAGTEGAHLLWGGDPTVTPFISIVFAGAGAVLTTYVHKATKSGGKAKQVLYTASTGGVTAGATAGLVTGLEGATLSGWILGGTVLSISHTVRRLIGAKEEGAKGSKWSRLEDAIGLGRFELKEAKSNGRGTVTAQIEAVDGATGDELTKRLGSLASVLKLGKGRITAIEDPEDSSRIEIRAVVEDLLRESIPWPGPSAFGASIAACPLVVARYEDGEDVPLNPTGLPGNVEHMAAQGTNGAGKTQWGVLAMADALTRTEVSVIAVNASKPQQDFGVIRHGITDNGMMIESVKGAKKFFATMPNVIKSRTDFLAAKGLKRWKPGCGLNFLIIWCEEAADYAADSAQYVHMLRTLRAAGGWVVTSAQRWTHDQVDTTARANHPAVAQFGVTDASDAGLLLPSELIEAGVNPEWGNRKPGRAYFVGAGTAEERWSMVARAMLGEDRALADFVSAGASVRTPLDSVTAGSFGALWTSRSIYTTPLLSEEDEDGEAGAEVTEPAPTPNPSAPAHVAAATAPTPEDDVFSDDEDDEAEALELELAEGRESLDRVRGMDLEPGQYRGAVLVEEIDPPTESVVTFEPEMGAGISSADAAEELARVLDRWAADGRGEFTPTDLKDVWLSVSVTDKRRWLYRQLEKLEDAGVISDPPEEYGVYYLLRSPYDTTPMSDAA
ncbi:hypothetical protein [Embleya sp. NPDC005971]|uniref:hypothetical protein n=1 Tax=Embleya sp. NPDC005971 TaxID=3156724 RepID=UPI0033E8F121